jgi:hypothetical protein
MTTTMRRLVWVLAAVGLMVCVLWPLSASAQTYVRPSKGAAFEPFGVVQPIINADVNQTSSVYDWTAFSGVRVDVLSKNTTLSNSGDILCSNVTPLTKVVPLVGNYLKFEVLAQASSANPPGLESPRLTELEFRVKGSAVREGPFILETEGYFYRQVAEDDVGSTSDFGLCPLSVVVTPLPFTQYSAVSVNNTVAEAVKTYSTQSKCNYAIGYGGQQAITPTTWTYIYNFPGSNTDEMPSFRVCHSRLNNFSPVYCTQDIQRGIGGNIINSIRASLELYPGDCENFTVNSINTSGESLPKVYCIAAEDTVVGVAPCMKEPQQPN